MRKGSLRRFAKGNLWDERILCMVRTKTGISGFESALGKDQFFFLSVKKTKFSWIIWSALDKKL